jgi:putative DNA primase/helicase
MDHFDTLRYLDPVLPSSLNDRACDNWRPLVTIAEVAGGDWPRMARQAAEALTSESDETSAGTLLLSDIRDIFSSVGKDRIFSGALCSELTGLVDKPWSESGKNGKGLTPNGLGRRLKPFGIKPSQIRIDSKTSKGYTLDDFKEAFERYLPSVAGSSANTTETPKQASEINGLQHDPSETAPAACSGCEPGNPLNSKGCFYVSDGFSGSGQDNTEGWCEDDFYASTRGRVIDIAPNVEFSPEEARFASLAASLDADAESAFEWDDELYDPAGESEGGAVPGSCFYPLQ